MFSYLVTSLLVGLAIAKIPTNISFCGRKNPDISRCFLDTAHKLIPELVHGVPEWDIPDTEPLYLKQIDVANDDTFTAKLNDVKVYGLSKLQILEATVDLDGGNIYANVTVPSIKVDGEYDGITRVLVTIPGKGPIIVVTDRTTAKLHLQLKYVDRKGAKYVYISAVTLKIDVTNFTATYKSYENPGGTVDEAINSALNGDRTNLLQTVMRTLEPAIAHLISGIGNNVTRHFTFDELFPDRE